MNRQICLEGFAERPLPEIGRPACFRRKTDREGRPRGPVDASSPLSATVQDESPGISVRVYTLGRFSLLLNGRPAEFGRKVPQRPLELLKLIIARGGRDISTATLAGVLWPDVEGDTAQRSLDTNLHRLRKLLGDDRVLVQRNGKVSLDGAYCRVDVWDFERLLGRLQRIRNKDTAGRQVFVLQQLMHRLLGLYRDHFLVNDDMTCWSVSLRERLRSKFVHCLLDVGRYWERHGFRENAIQCYQKGLEVDDLIEVFYQRLMSCYLKTGRLSEGMSIYRRCRRILSVVLGLQPEPETQKLYHSLKEARPSKQTV
jgi:DNA-binding SARP family transcriptional activator